MARETHNRLVNSIVDRYVAGASERYLRGRLVDIGCGEKPYEAMVRPFVDEHIGVDHAGSFHSLRDVDIVADAYDIPVEDESFDSALATSLLEHLEEPEQAIRECHRVLRQNGIAIYTVPMIWHIHEEPRDFYRFTEYGLRYLFEKSGFELVEVTPMSGFWVTFGQMSSYYVNRLNKGPLRTLRIIDMATLAIQGIAGLLERVDRPTKWTWMYLVVARKR